MRPLLSRASSSDVLRANSSSPAPTSFPPSSVSTIRLVSATASAAGSASDADNSFANTTASSSFVAVSYPASPASPLAPRVEAESSRRRLVPKKSKLGLLGTSARSNKERGKDMSDMLRRVTGDVKASSSARGGFEIYVDPTTDPDLSEVVVVKKKKSRGALNTLGWGGNSNVLSDATNTNASSALLTAPKAEEKDKWWSIGRGRKVSKDGNKVLKENAKPAKAALAPVHIEPSSSRSRFNSFDSGALLGSRAVEPQRSRSISGTQLLSVPDLAYDEQMSSPGSPDEAQTPTLLVPPGSATGSIAVRAMRSMRSMAHMASWAQLKPVEKEEPLAKKKEKEKEGVETKKKRKDKKKGKGEDGRKATIRNLSSSSFEAGALTTPDAESFPHTVFQEPKRKASMLGLGLPSTMRFGSARAVSSSSSTNSFGALSRPPSRLSQGSSVNLEVPAPSERRPSSTTSTGSSLRPPSTISASSRTSSSGSGSVKWDERGLETAKEQRRQEREAAKPRETRRTSDGHRRTALTNVFPDLRSTSRPQSQSSQCSAPMPIVMIEEATADGHSMSDSASYGTPSRRRVRPVSEQMYIKERPKAICEDDDGVISILDAATNDLASLISRLDLEASPATPNCSPLRQSPNLSKLFEGSKGKPGATEHGSPVRKPHSSTGPTIGLRTSQASVTSLRPYAQRRGKTAITEAKSSGTGSRLGQQIAPWPISPTKPEAKIPQEAGTVASARSPSTFKRVHRRTLSPTPDQETPVVFRALQPSSRKPSLTTAPDNSEFRDALAPLVFRRAGNIPPPLHLDTKGSLSSLISDSAVRTPIAPEARRGLGTAGTLGGSVGSADSGRLVESDDPDSDIPDELQLILSAHDSEHFEDTMSFNPVHSRPLPSPGSPPGMPLPSPVPSFDGADAPVFHAMLMDEAENQAEIDDIESDEDGTKKSFDFTGELKMLNELADRKSFVEQLETAFKTPAKFDLEGFGEFRVDVDAPPVPPLPLPPVPQVAASSSTSSLDMLPAGTISSLLPSPEISIPHRDRQGSSLYDASFPQTVKSLSSDASLPRSIQSSTSGFSMSSNGELNVNFRFGGKASAEPEHVPSSLTLSDIIPPPEIQNRLSMISLVDGDSSVVRSIMAQAHDVMPPVSSQPAPRRRTLSDSSSRFFERNSFISYRDSFASTVLTRPPSEASFSGFDSFDEIRRGFEFGPDRPAFYPPPDATTRRGHNTHESSFSIASVSSYGAVLNPGVQDPFDYGRYDLPSRPSSDSYSLTMSLSTSVDDTFDFMHRRDSRRPRVDSDASSFYFRPSAPSLSGRRPTSMFAYRRDESTTSPMSIAPPVSLYNRSFNHRRMDSNSSASSVAHAYAMGAQRMSWDPRHRRDMSLDSIISDVSAMRVSRPGLSGDKMLESAHGMPLTAISGSPPESLRSERFDRPSYKFSAEYDSIMDGTRAMLGPSTSAEDSIFDKTGHRTSTSSESLFGGKDDNPQARHQFQSARYRPVSMWSITEDIQHNGKREDDTMITMLDGGQVRRRSMDSVVGGSPCVQIGKRKHAAIRGPQDNIAGSDGEVEHMESPNKMRLVEKPSIASIASMSSNVFGGERMLNARHGLLKRDSLEVSALEADGEDLSASFSFGPVFTRPSPAARSRSSTHSSSSGADTPPLSACDGSQSSSSDSQSSIDIASLNIALANMTHPVTSRTRIRSHRRGHGHRMDRSARQSVYETIVEETNQYSPTKASPSPAAPLAAPVDDIMVVDMDTTSFDWNEESSVMALRKYYALRDEAHVTVEDSKRLWADTPFSLFAVQSFNPPVHGPGMRALLEYSQQNYGPLPFELRPHRIRSRTSSRASPYPAMRTVKRSLSPSAQRPFQDPSPVTAINRAPPSAVLQDRTQNANTPHTVKKERDQGKLSVKNSLPTAEVSPFVPENMSKLSNGLPRPRVGSNARRNALGWAKRGSGKENKENKENRSHAGSEDVSFGVGTSATPGKLRFSRPRPRGRATPALGRPATIRI